LLSIKRKKKGKDKREGFLMKQTFTKPSCTDDSGDIFTLKPHWDELAKQIRKALIL
jgi:hypothetical protein